VVLDTVFWSIEDSLDFDGQIRGVAVALGVWLEVEFDEDDGEGVAWWVRGVVGLLLPGVARGGSSRLGLYILVRRGTLLTLRTTMCPLLRLFWSWRSFTNTCSHLVKGGD